MTDIQILDPWYTSLIDDCKAIVTEAVHLSRWELIVGYHTLGKRIVTDKEYQRKSKGNGKCLQGLAEDINQSERTVYYAVQFYTKFPNPDEWPFDKNMSWTKITQLLPDGKHTEARSFAQSIKTFEASFGKLLDRYPDRRDEIIAAFWRVVGGEWQKGELARLRKIEAAVKRWRKEWPDENDINEMKDGCDCEICNLIRSLESE